MSGRRLTILAIVLLALSGCGEDKAAGDKAAADVTAAAKTKKDAAAADRAAKAAKGKTAKGKVEDDAAPVLTVPEGFSYESRGRRDPFVNPIPKPPPAPPKADDAAATARPDGLPGVLVAEARITGTVISKEPGMTKAIITAPGKRTFFAVRGDTLFDGVIKEISKDEVVFTMISPSTRQPVNREMTVKTGAIAGTAAGDKK